MSPHGTGERRQRSAQYAHLCATLLSLWQPSRSELFLMFRDKLADGRNKVMGDLHYGVVGFLECRFILGHRLFRRLLFIVRKDAPPVVASRAPVCQFMTCSSGDAASGSLTRMLCGQSARW